MLISILQGKLLFIINEEVYSCENFNDDVLIVLSENLASMKTIKNLSLDFKE